MNGSGPIVMDMKTQSINFAHPVGFNGRELWLADLTKHEQRWRKRRQQGRPEPPIQGPRTLPENCTG